MSFEEIVNKSLNQIKSAEKGDMLEEKKDYEKWYCDGISLAFWGKYQEAIKAFNQSIELNPSNSNAIDRRNKLLKVIEYNDPNYYFSDEDSSVKQVGKKGIFDKLFGEREREKETFGGVRCYKCGEQLWLQAAISDDSMRRRHGFISGNSVQELFTHLQRQPRACPKCGKNFCSACTYNSSIKRFICPNCGKDLGDLESRSTLIKD